MKKKLLASTLALTLSAALVACSTGGTTPASSKVEGSAAAQSEAPAGEQQVLKFAALESGYGADLWNEVTAEFEKAENVKVELTMHKEIEDVLSPQMKAGQFPDVVHLGLGRPKALTETLLKEKAIEEITDIFDMKVPGEEKTVKEKLMPGVLGTTVTNPYRDDKTYLAPVFYAPTGLFYNKALFAAKGWEVPKDMDAMKDLAEKAKAEGIALFTYPTHGYLDTFFPVLLANAGGVKEFQDAMSYKEGAYTNEAATQAFEAMATLLANVEKTTVANANNEGFKKNQQLILDNKALFMPNGTWVVGEMADAPRAEGFEWGMAAAPAIKAGGEQNVFAFMEQMWVPAAAEHKDLAKKFLTFLYSDKAVELLAKHNANQPIQGISKFVNADQKVFYDFVDQASGLISGTFAATKPVEGVNISDTLYGAVASVASGEKTVSDWQKSVEEVSSKLRAALE